MRSSPLEPDGYYYCPDLTPAKAHFYLRLPKTPFCIGNPHRDYAASISCSKEELELLICNGSMEKGMGILPHPCDYGVTAYYYNYRMELLR